MLISVNIQTDFCVKQSLPFANKRDREHVFQVSNCEEELHPAVLHITPRERKERKTGRKGPTVAKNPVTQISPGVDVIKLFLQEI